MNTAQILNECKRKYEGTYVFSKDNNGNEFPCHVRVIEIQGQENKATGSMTLRSNKFGTLVYSIPSNEAMILKQVTTTVFQLGRDAYYVDRFPQRQWQRGISQNNTRLINLSQWALRGFHDNNPGRELNIDLVEAMFNPTTYSLREAIALIKKAVSISVAMKDGWSLIQSPTEEDFPMLCYRLSPIAQISEKGEIFKEYHTQLNRERDILLEELK